MITDGLTDETIEQWIRDDQADVAERILLSLYEQISILKAAVIELSDSLELTTDILGNTSHVPYDLFWSMILFNEFVHLKLAVAVQIQNVILWIAFLNPNSQRTLPETRRFFKKYGRQLVQWGQEPYHPSGRLREVDEIVRHVIELRESIAHLTRAKEYTAKLLRTMFSTQV